MHSIKVVDFTHGKKDSDNVDTNIPFKKNFAEAKTIQSANVVIAGYINKNITDLAKLENETNILKADVTNLNNETNVLKADVTNLNNEIKLKADKTEIPTKTSELTNDSNYITPSYHDATKQDILVSGTNIKTINNQDILGSGNIVVESSAVWGNITGELHNQQDLHNELQAKANFTDLPTKTSELTNDSGYITNEYHDATKQDVINNLDIINNNLKFSSNEIVVGEYLNKPLYRKVMEFGNLPNKTVVYKNHGISNIDKIIGIKAIGTDGTHFYPIPFVPTVHMFSNTSVTLRANKTQVGVFASSDFTSHTATIILEYTKTTDSEIV